ncbi:MAG: Gfo/Idh/MocA family oxidoreductase [Pirellulales bacterium]|nr:Gfo/Idh/MocA family oxidoreductase [Pirellulales bacterium]
MTENLARTSSRRDFLKNTSRIVGASALAGTVIPHVQAASDGENTIRIALVGCGGRGTGAANDALSSKHGPIQLVAMADVFENRLASSYRELKNRHPKAVDVPKDQQFVGFDAYQEAMDCLRPGDVAIFGTPPAFRWVHFAYAIQKGLNVFMEKPVTVDGPTSVRMLKLADESAAKNLKVGVGLMSRHNRALQELAKRVQDGAIGDIILERGYRMHGPLASFSSPPKPANEKELLYQIKRFHSFIWASGGNFSDFYIHIIDHLCWMKGQWPIKAQALGGRHYREYEPGVPSIDQNLDTYSVEYTFADGGKFFFDGRCMTGCQDIYSSYLHGSKGSAVVSRSGDCGPPSSIHKDQNFSAATRVWESEIPSDQQNPYQNEWDDLLAAIRGDQPYNEARRGVEASLVTSLGRMAAHIGVEVTYEDILKCPHEMAPDLDKLTMDSPAPVQADSDGKYPVPMPGIKRRREY